ncbi:hypothetical protein BX666DRAFT_300371 [Dichotomocladium elegans]|nr:hypothetical protein BX666DRAFT_300371 [Dichotomocladium elegans]
MDSNLSEERSSFVSDYEFIGAGSVNHPSVDRGSEFSYSSDLYSRSLNENYATKKHGARRKRSLLAIPRPASLPNNQTQQQASFASFHSEIVVKGAGTALSTTTSTSANSNNTTSDRRQQLLDASSETRRRIERSLSNIRSMSRHAPRSSITGEEEDKNLRATINASFDCRRKRPVTGLSTQKKHTCHSLSISTKVSKPVLQGSII